MPRAGAAIVALAQCAFTDLLLHDMGPDLAGEVSFGTPQMGANDPLTTEAEWRTALLWGAASNARHISMTAARRPSRT